ncbi:MAG: helix-turn-helix transcriptional regulator, partial [Frankiales bacterium]|nr:helix-turn-helix transcriptional regulator [Frankiales bacterium]
RASAQVSLGYLSEVERGRKEPSSELLSSICTALGVSLGELLREVSDELLLIERRSALVRAGFAGGVAPGRPQPARPAPAVAGLAPYVAPRRPSAPARPEPVAPVALLSLGFTSDSPVAAA